MDRRQTLKLLGCLTTAPLQHAVAARSSTVQPITALTPGRVELTSCCYQHPLVQILHPTAEQRALLYWAFNEPPSRMFAPFGVERQPVPEYLWLSLGVSAMTLRLAVESTQQAESLRLELIEAGLLTANEVWVQPTDSGPGLNVGFCTPMAARYWLSPLLQFLRVEVDPRMVSLLEGFLAPGQDDKQGWHLLNLYTDGGMPPPWLSNFAWFDRRGRKISVVDVLSSSGVEWPVTCAWDPIYPASHPEWKSHTAERLKLFGISDVVCL